jgi:hypothetical protein
MFAHIRALSQLRSRKKFQVISEVELLQGSRLGRRVRDAAA